MRLRHGLLMIFLVNLTLASMAADPAYDVSIPEGWEKRGSVDQFLYQKDTESFSISVEPLSPEGNAPDEYVARVKSDMRRTVANCLFKPIKAGNKDGYETRSLSYSIAYSNIEFRYDVLYVFAKNRVYIIQVCDSERKLVQDYTPDVEAIFAGFHIK